MEVAGLTIASVGASEVALSTLRRTVGFIGSSQDDIRRLHSIALAQYKTLGEIFEDLCDSTDISVGYVQPHFPTTRPEFEATFEEQLGETFQVFISLMKSISECSLELTRRLEKVRLNIYKCLHTHVTKNSLTPCLQSKSNFAQYLLERGSKLS